MAYNEKLGYHDETQVLIDHMCAIAERPDYTLEKKLAEEKALATFDLFDLARPKKLVWHTDLLSALRAWRASRASSASRAWRASRASSAWSASRALRAWRASSASSASSASRAWRASRASSASSAWSASRALRALSALSALSASSASRAWRAWSIDYDFDYFVLASQYQLDPTEGAPNENDKKYLQYSELLVGAKEAGLGYWFQDGDTLHLVPVPITVFDSQARFHCESGPAVRWKGGEELFYLKGERFDKDLWQKIVDKTITLDEVMQITDVDKREIAFSMLGAEEMLKGLDAKLIDTGKKDGTRLYQCDNFKDTGETRYLMVMDDPGTPRQFVEGVPADIGKKRSADLAQATAMGLTVDEYMSIELRA